MLPPPLPMTGEGDRFGFRGLSDRTPSLPSFHVALPIDQIGRIQPTYTGLDYFSTKSALCAGDGASGAGESMAPAELAPLSFGFRTGTTPGALYTPSFLSECRLDFPFTPGTLQVLESAASDIPFSVPTTNHHYLPVGSVCFWRRLTAALTILYLVLLLSDSTIILSDRCFVVLVVIVEYNVHHHHNQEAESRGAAAALTNTVDRKGDITANREPTATTYHATD